jgi:heme exporter protein D
LITKILLQDLTIQVPTLGPALFVWSFAGISCVLLCFVVHSPATDAQKLLKNKELLVNRQSVILAPGPESARTEN